ncbi:MAG: hypothetical protein P4M15_06700, partial [Alphaproteobacteria bacterium]|nr:hypothetical protein [Alphaproteobacteria bacterium]
GLHIVGGTAPIPLTARDKLALAFGSPSWDTYDALQEIFWEKISVGILHADGSTTLADISPEGDFLNDTDAPHSAPLYQWVHQLANGLDLAFKSDLKFAAPSPRPTTGANPPFIPG